MKITRYFSSRIIGPVCTAVLALCAFSANAQQQSEIIELPKIITFTAQDDLRAGDAARILAGRLHLNAGTDELRSAYIEQPGEGLQVQRFNQYFKGIRVTHGTYTLTSKNGIASYAFGKFYPVPENNNTIPKIDEAAALSKALAYSHAEKYNWEDAPSEYPKGTLCFTEDFTNGTGDGVLHLTYAFDIYATEPLSRNMVYVDAQSGKILFIDAILKHASASGASLYSDTLSIQGGQAGSLIYLHDSTRGSGIFTYNLNKATSIPSASSTNLLTSTLQVTSAGTLFVRDAAIDAHWGAEVVYDYWKNINNRNSWNGTNGALKSYVHYGNSYNNAMWNGSAMVYGDGSGNSAPLTSLDVCGHEIGHGICQSTANLVYSMESGAMNEGFSDIWGAVIENYADPHEKDAVAKNNWLMAEELGTPFRSMANPKLYGQPDTYQGINWIYTGPGCATSNDNCGVHTNSGVLNYWFYMLCVGGKGTNDVSNTYQVPAIGMAKSAKIAYATELALYNTAKYADCRIASIAAATALYGACSPEVEAVTRAWYAVGVGADYTAPCTPQVSFSAASNAVTENASENACPAKHTVSVPVVMNGPAITGGSATVTATAIGGTAIAGIDYDLTTPTATFTVGGAATQYISLTVYDNGTININKYVDLVYALASGSSNATKSLVLDTTRVFITDDEHTLVEGGLEQHQALINNTAGIASSPFYGSVLGARSQYIYRAQELLAAGVRPNVPITAADFFVIVKNSGTQPFIGYTMKLANTAQSGLSTGFVAGGFTTVYSANLTTATGWNSLPFSAPFIWNGTDNLAVEICFTNPVASSANDRVYAQLGSYTYAAYATSNSASGCSLPFNVNNLISSRPVINFSQQASPTPIETAQNGTRTWEVKPGQQQVYFYSYGADKLIASMLAPSVNMGCVTATVTASGNGFATTPSRSRRSVKEFSITTAQPVTGASFDAVFYFSNAELAGTDPYNVHIVQTTSANDAGMTPANMEIVTPSDVFFGQNYTGFRGTFNGFGRFFATDGDFTLGVGNTPAKPAELWTGANPFHAAPVLYWNLPAPERVSIRLYDVTGKLVYGAEKTLDGGAHQLSVSGGADFAPGTYVLQVVRPSGVFTRQLVKQ